MNNTKIKTFEAICLLTIVIVSHSILNIPQTLLNLCGPSSLLNIIYITILAILIFLLIVKLFKKFPNSDIIDIAEFLGGKWLKIIFGILIVGYITFSASVLLRNAIEALRIIYYLKASSSFIILFFLITPILANLFGENVITRCNVIITPIMVILLLIAFLAVSPLFTFQRIFPILGYGFKETFLLGTENLFAFNGLLLLMLVLPSLANKDNFKKIGLISISIIGILLFLFIGTLLLAFPFVLSVETIEPIYLLVVNTQFSEFLQRPEALFVLIFILFFMSYLNIVVLYGVKILKKITKISKPKTFALPLSTLIFILTFIPVGMTEVRFLENTVYKYLTLSITFVICIFILILANIKFKILSKRGAVH